MARVFTIVAIDQVKANVYKDPSKVTVVKYHKVNSQTFLKLVKRQHPAAAQTLKLLVKHYTMNLFFSQVNF